MLGRGTSRWPLPSPTHRCCWRRWGPRWESSSERSVHGSSGNSARAINRRTGTRAYPPWRSTERSASGAGVSRGPPCSSCWRQPCITSLGGDTPSMRCARGGKVDVSRMQFLVEVPSYTLANVGDVRLPNATDDELRQLSWLPEIRGLSVSGKAMTDEGFSHISRLRSLKFLTFSRAHISPSGMARLGVMPDLEYLFMEEMQIEEACMRELARVMPRLDTLSLEEMQIEMGCIREIAACRGCKRFFSSTPTSPTPGSNSWPKSGACKADRPSLPYITRSHGENDEFREARAGGALKRFGFPDCFVDRRRDRRLSLWVIGGQKSGQVALQLAFNSPTTGRPPACPLRLLHGARGFPPATRPTPEHAPATWRPNFQQVSKVSAKLVFVRASTLARGKNLAKSKSSKCSKRHVLMAAFRSSCS